MYAEASSRSRIARAIISFPAPAQACRVAENQGPILHETLPALPDGAVAAEVEITADVRSTPHPSLEARIISMIVGDYAGSKMRIEPRMRTSCDAVPSLGSRGIIAGLVLARSEEALVIDAIRAQSETKLRNRRTRARDAHDGTVANDARAKGLQWVASGRGNGPWVVSRRSNS